MLENVGEGRDGACGGWDGRLFTVVMIYDIKNEHYKFRQISSAPI